LFVFGYLAVAGTRRVTGRDLLAAAAMSAGIGVFLRLAAPSGGRLHAPGSSWLLAGLVTAGVVVAALAVASGLSRRPRAAPGHRGLPSRRRIGRTCRHPAAAGPGGRRRSARTWRPASAGRVPVPPPPRPGSDHPGRPWEIKTLIPNRLRPDRCW